MPDDVEFSESHSASLLDACPYHVLKEVLADPRRLGLNESPLFPTASGGVVLKDAIVTSWRRLGSTPVDVTGHSPRRSGPKCPARLGWSLADMQLLDCWQSDVVRSYVDEASAERCFELEWSEPTGGQASCPTPCSPNDYWITAPSGRLHSLAFSTWALSSLSWRTSCGWKYATGRVELVPSGADGPRCAKSPKCLSVRAA
eukprot:6474795-Amphidinium_carterae.1